MKTIGILGGMSAASTQLYYQHLCTLTREQLGGLHSPELLIKSVNFAEIEHFQASGDWHAAAYRINTEAKQLERGGADILLLASNTMHKVADDMMSDVTIPMIHIADATAARIVASGFSRPGLMATRFTMEQKFYTDRLVDANLHPLLPCAEHRAMTHAIIYDELCKGIVTSKSQNTYIAIAQQLVNTGADCLILGCTEVGMLLNQSNVTVPVFDSTLIHCEQALEMALNSTNA